MRKNSNKILRGGPVVCAVGCNYHIMVPVKKKVLMSIVVDGKTYYNHSNGIRRTDVIVQKFVIPQETLNKSKKYTVIYEEMLIRKAYSCVKGAKGEIEYNFKPIEKDDNINIYHISDCHGLLKPAVSAGEFFEKDLDLLILNGDIASSSSKISDILLTYDIAFGITKGEIPCVISRGNHDLRGKMAEKLDMLLPTDKGNTYYTIKLNNLWMMLIDCGEDKDDEHDAYSGTIACHQFREEQQEFIEKVAADKDNEYGNEDIKYKIVISHIPFSHNNMEFEDGIQPFNIETQMYTHWCEILSKKIKPHFFLAGHIHSYEICPVGGKYDNKGLACPTIIGSKPVKDASEESMIGTAITLFENFADVKFTNSKKEVLAQGKIEF